MEKPKPKDVDSYIANSNAQARAIMVELRKMIRSIIPEAEEVISWNVPIYKYHGILAGFSVAKQHVSLGLDTLQVKDRETLEEKGYKTGKKTVQIKFGQKVPVSVLKKCLKVQARINEEKKITQNES